MSFDVLILCRKKIFQNFSQNKNVRTLSAAAIVVVTKRKHQHTAPAAPLAKTLITIKIRIIIFFVITLIIFITVTIISTRPKPAYGRQGLAGSWGQNTDEVSTFLGALNVSFRACGSQLGFKPT